MQQEFKVGELVDITIRCARVVPAAVDPDAMPYIKVHVGTEEFLMEIPVSSLAVTVERVAPAEWPPVAGDLWRDARGGLWFAHVVLTRGGQREMRLQPHHESDDGYWTPWRLLAERGPLALVHREPQPDVDDFDE
jgi:hypothetical protein